MTYAQLKTFAITALGLIGVISLGLFIGSYDGKTIEPITIDGELIEFPYTDSTDGEDLLIFSDKAEYTNGFSHATIYLAIANDSGVDQEMELTGYFRDNKKKIKDIAILTRVTQEEQEPVFTEYCGKINTGTTTINQCEKLQTSTSTKRVTKAIWAPLPTISRDTLEITKEAGLLEGKTRKQVENFIAENKSIGFPIKTGEVLYYKVQIEFPPQGRDEVFFEVIGSAGGYGFLR